MYDVACEFSCAVTISLRSKRFRSTRTKFGRREVAVRIRAESKKLEGAGWGRGKKGTLARKPLDFEKPVRSRTGLLIGVAWSS